MAIQTTVYNDYYDSSTGNSASEVSKNQAKTSAKVRHQEAMAKATGQYGEHMNYGSAWNMDTPILDELVRQSRRNGGPSTKSTYISNVLFGKDWFKDTFLPKATNTAKTVVEKIPELTDEVVSAITGDNSSSGPGGGVGGGYSSANSDGSQDIDAWYQKMIDAANANNQWSAEQAQKQMDFQKMMSDTAHQREVADLKAAGLNPVLSAGGQGASTPSGASASAENNSSALAQIAMFALESAQTTSAIGMLKDEGIFSKFAKSTFGRAMMRTLGNRIGSSAFKFIGKHLGKIF